MNLLTDVNLKVSLHESKGYAIFLSLLPVLMMHRTPGMSLGLSTMLIAAGMVYAGCVIYVHWRRIDLNKIFVFLPYLLYAGYSGNGIYRLLAMAILVHLLAICSGAVHYGRLKSMLIGVACVASGCVLLQHLLHWTVGLDLQFLYKVTMLESLQRDGYNGIFDTYHYKGMYRPAAFFLEPSHFAQYSFVGLCACLFSTAQTKWKQALLITAGMFATTSGIGFVLTSSIWLWWRLTKIEDFPIIYKVLLFLGVCVLAACSLFVLYQIPFFESIISRFLDTPEGEVNAVDGRTFGWGLLFEGKDFWELFWGYGADTLPPYFLTGMMEQLYVYGWLGVGLLFMYLAWLCLFTKGLARIVSILFFSLYFVAGVSGFVHVIFYIGTILTCYIFQYEEG